VTPFLAIAKATLVCAGMALAFSWAFGVGEYTLAPDGAYNAYAVESVSHDWHQYLWFFSTEPRWWFVLLAHGLVGGFIYSILLVPIVVTVAFTLCWRLPSLRAWLLAANKVPLAIAAIVIGLAGGTVSTILGGRNPGII